MKESNQQIIYWLYHPYFLNILTAPLQTPSPLRSAIHWNGYNFFLKLRYYLRYLGNEISPEKLPFSFIVREPKSVWMSKKTKQQQHGGMISTFAKMKVRMFVLLSAETIDGFYKLTNAYS